MELKEMTQIVTEIQNRRSPRAFSTEDVNDETLHSLFEAARWAASSMNEQPWLFLFARKGEDSYNKILESLMPGNVAWAKNAPVLVVSFYKTHFTNSGALNKSAHHDLGLAMGNLSIQAQHLGIGVHMMGGFNADIIKSNFSIPEDYEVSTVNSLGYYGLPEELEEPYRSRETAPRKRKELNEIVFESKF